MKLSAPTNGLRRLFVLSALIAATLFAATAGAQTNPQFRFAAVDAPGAGYFTGVLGINNFGDLAGVRDGADGHAHGFVRIGGSHYYTIDFPGATDTNALNINDNGDITGVYFDTAGFEHGYVLHQGHYSSIDVPGAAQTSGIDFEFGTGLGTGVFRMNDLGALVGQYADPAGYSHGFKLQHGHYETIDFSTAGHLPGLGTEAIAINNFGVIAGGYSLDPVYYGHGFVLANGHFTTIDVPGAGGSSGTQCNGINDEGVVVGPYSDANDHIHGYIWRQGKFSYIDYPNAVDSESDGINNLGVIIGQYTDSTGLTHGYVATPKR